MSKKKQRIERQMSSSEQASIPDSPAVAMVENTEYAEEVPVVAKRRTGKKGMRTVLTEELREDQVEIHLAPG